MLSILLGSERKGHLDEQAFTLSLSQLMEMNVKSLSKDRTQCEVNKKETEDRTSFLFRAILIIFLNKFMKVC